MKRKEYFKQSLCNVSVKIVAIAIIVFLSCLAAGIAWGVLYLMEHFMSAETVRIILFSISAIILAYYIIKYGLMLIFNIYHFFVCLYLIDKLNDRQFALYKKYVYGDKNGVFLGERNADVTKYLKKFNPIRYRKYKDILERQEEQDG